MSDKSHTKKETARLSRRSFIKGAGAAAAVASLVGIRPAASEAQVPTQPAAEGIAERIGPDAQAIELTINGQVRRLAVEPRLTLLRALREHLGLTGTKLVCDRGACGACTVHLDGKPVTSCMVLAIDARGHEITTIEGLGTPDQLNPVQAAFVEADALQCGFCTPGMVMSVAAAIDENPALSVNEIKRAVTGNICRCGTYPHVFKAAVLAAQRVRGLRTRGGVA